MKNFINLIFIILLSISCSKKINNKIDKQKQYTIIFDFDDTIYSHNGKPNAYSTEFYLHALKRTRYSSGEMFKFIADNKLKLKKPNDAVARMTALQSKFNVKFNQSDIDYNTKDLNEGQTIGLGDIMKNLVQEGYHVMVLGGGVFGCALMPDFLKQFGIKKEDIYSGYFRDFSKESLDKVYHRKWQYVNCAYPDVDTVFSEKKSDLITLLKRQNKINKNHKIIHVGDGVNDLEAFRNKQSDIFIGFGIHVVNNEVEKEAPIFVRTIDEFKQKLNKILSN
jgi:2-hydroxy-3-keto-5-methylthiopentenyl-1-phosphate phosphatase